MSELPRTVRIREVGPRDGFQNEPEVISTERKVELIDALARTGLRRLEVTSFVRADVIPQLADAEEVLARVSIPEEVAVSVLIPNERGLDRALALREASLRCEGVISTSFGCPYEGHVPPARVLEIAARLRDAGAQEIRVSETTG